LLLLHLDFDIWFKYKPHPTHGIFAYMGKWLLCEYNTPWAKYMVHVISVLSVKWAFIWEVDSTLNLEMVCYVLYILDIRWWYSMFGTKFWLELEVLHIWLWLMELNLKIGEATCIYCMSFLPYLEATTFTSSLHLFCYFG